MNAFSNDRSVEYLLGDAERLATAYTIDPTAPVAACDGWDVDRILTHTGGIHRWARHCVVEGSPPDDRSGLRPPDGADRAEWFREGAVILGESLRAIDPDAPTWHPFPAEQVAGFWPRRMVHETSIHRWDAEAAVGSTPAGIDAELASDGIDEYLDVIIRRLVADGTALPNGSLHLHCTDVEGEWLVSSDDDGYQLVRAHQKGDAALRGPAAQILLALWQRDGHDDELSPVGDETVLSDWLAVGGN